MLEITRQELRKMTDEAIAGARREVADAANRIFQSALSHLKVELLAGRNYAVVMSLKAGVDYTEATRGRTGKSCNPPSLTGTGALVFKMCEVFSPTLEFWTREEGDQRDSYTVEGFNIVLHWTDAADLLNRVERLGDTTLAGQLRAAIKQVEDAIADKVKRILAKLKETAAIQARAGKGWAIVMSIRNGTDFTRPDGVHRADVCKPEWLGPIAKAVWDACADFAPALEYWSREEGDQRDSYTVDGFNIVIHW
jgi:hypothetical protein